MKQLLDVLLDEKEFDGAKKQWRDAQEEREEQERSDVEGGSAEGGLRGWSGGGGRRSRRAEGERAERGKG